MNKYKITSPCTQDWNAMQRVDGGRFCKHCNKTVHDLTDGKDFIPPTTNETFCGRIIDETAAVPKKISFSRLIFWQRIVRLSPLLASLLLGKTAYSQTKDTIIYSKEKIDIKTQEQEVKGKIEISGKLRDKTTLEGIPFADVLIYQGVDQLTVGITDINGLFKIILDTSVIKGKTIDVRVAYVGYEGLILKDIPISKKDFVIDLKLNMCTAMVGGIGFTICYPHLFEDGTAPSGKVISSDDIKHAPR